MDRIGNEKGKLRFIVLPLQPETPDQYDGVGLALHFLLGNTVVLNTNLKEFWFGWRTKKLFPKKEDLTTYLVGQNNPLAFKQLSEEQKIRFWLYGRVKGDAASLSIYDSVADSHADSEIRFSTEDHLTGFRQAFIRQLSGYGIAFPETMQPKALWPETISREGLDVIGRALESFYYYSAHTDRTGRIDTALFEKAVALAPESFMTQNLLGWAHYRNKDYQEARTGFLRAVLVNAAGTGAMSGLMWCGIYMQNKEEALYWASRAAEVRNQDVAKARQKTIKRWKKYNT